MFATGPRDDVAGFVSGSNGFPDYTAGTWTRSNVALYGDVELRVPDDRWTVGGAVRFEHFDIFGATTNGKLSVRYGVHRQNCSAHEIKDLRSA